MPSAFDTVSTIRSREGFPRLLKQKWHSFKEVCLLRKMTTGNYVQDSSTLCTGSIRQEFMMMLKHLSKGAEGCTRKNENAVIIFRKEILVFLFLLMVLLLQLRDIQVMS